MRSNEFKSSNIFFTSDHHFYHKNVIKYCNRPYSSVQEMNEDLVKRWNEKVDKYDVVFELGDMFPFCSAKEAADILDKLNGLIISLKGNHFNQEFPKIFTKIKYYDILDIRVEDFEVSDSYQRINLCHYPFLRWNHQHRGSWQLYGHTHHVDSMQQKNQFHAGVDTCDYYPLSYEEIKIQITKDALK